jgi:hypothetical protein
MQKVSENVDLSAKVLEIDIESEIFESMLRDLNLEILRCIKNVYDEKFEAGEISLKLNIELPTAYETFQKADKETGEILNETFKYRKPNFEHKITTTLKMQYKQDGGYTDRREVRFEDGKFVAVPVKEAQMSMFESHV